MGTRVRLAVIAAFALATALVVGAPCSWAWPSGGGMTSPTDVHVIEWGASSEPTVTEAAAQEGDEEATENETEEGAKSAEAPRQTAKKAKESHKKDHPKEKAAPKEIEKSETPPAEEPRTDDLHEKADANILQGSTQAMNVRVTSWKDLPFQTVKRQTYDYSCGSAALATLLTYAYGVKTTEEEVFKAMFDAGDKEKIRKEGFSLLDMRNYLASQGFDADGYKIRFKAIEKHKVPFIALITRDGYTHFVVVKSVGGPAILIGDPSRGNMVLTREEFGKMWNGISLIVKNHARAARKLFTDPQEWHYAHARGTPELGEHSGMDSVGLPFPNWQIAPSGTEMLSVVNSTF